MRRSARPRCGNRLAVGIVAMLSIIVVGCAGPSDHRDSAESGPAGRDGGCGSQCPDANVPPRDADTDSRLADGGQPKGLQAFWRSAPVTGPGYETEHRGVIAIPDYLLGSDFPYRKRPTALEVPFADHLTVVRLLGGYTIDGASGPECDPSRDLVYRDGEGDLVLRTQLLRDRLQQYVDAGYERDMTLVLDDIPCDLVTDHVIGDYGQIAAPDDPQQWGDFIGALTSELKLMLGSTAANALRFRIGTEATSRRRFLGSQQQFFAFYDHAAAAIREVLPGARIGPPQCGQWGHRGHLRCRKAQHQRL